MKLAVIAVLVLVGLAVGQTIRPIPDTQVRIVGHIPAEWWVYVEIENVNGVPARTYTVPAMHYLVVTRVDFGGYVLADSQNVALRLAAIDSGSSIGTNTGNGTRVAFGPGTDLSSDHPGSATFRLWGYLEPVR